jgi:hypothetical protein
LREHGQRWPSSADWRADRWGQRATEFKILIIDTLLPQALVLLLLPTLLMTAEACGPPGHLMVEQSVQLAY